MLCGFVSNGVYGCLFELVAFVGHVCDEVFDVLLELAVDVLVEELDRCVLFCFGW